MTEYYTARDMVEAFVTTEIVPVAVTWDERRQVGGREVSCGCAVVALAAAKGVSLAAHPDRAFLDVIYVAANVLGTDPFFLTGVVAGWDLELDEVHAYETPGGRTLWLEGYRQGRKARRWVDRFGVRYGLAVHRDAA